MGYRSEVAFAVGPPLVDKFLAVMASSEKVRDLIKWDDKIREGMRFDYYEKGDIFVILSSVKWHCSTPWYEGCEAVDKIMEFINNASEDMNEEEWIRFVRIGEELDDIEQMGYYKDDRIYVPIPHIEY